MRDTLIIAAMALGVLVMAKATPSAHAEPVRHIAAIEHVVTTR